VWSRRDRRCRRNCGCRRSCGRTRGGRRRRRHRGRGRHRRGCRSRGGGRRRRRRRQHTARGRVCMQGAALVGKPLRAHAGDRAFHADRTPRRVGCRLRGERCRDGGARSDESKSVQVQPPSSLTRNSRTIVLTAMAVRHHQPHKFVTDLGSVATRRRSLSDSRRFSARTRLASARVSRGAASAARCPSIRSRRRPRALGH